MPKKVNDIITRAQREELRAAGFVVVHKNLTGKMMKSMSNKAAGFGFNAAYSRAITASIIEQGESPDAKTHQPYTE